MLNNPLYGKFKELVLNNNYTVEQVQELSINQAAKLLGAGGFSCTFWDNMKRAVIAALQSRDDQNNLEQLRQTAKSWLDTNFPSWEAEIEREKDKPCVKLWLKGKP